MFPKILSEFGSLLYEGAVITIGGTVSSREDEDSKVLVNTVKKVEKTPSDEDVSFVKPEVPANTQPREINREVRADKTYETHKSLRDVESLYLKVDTKDGVLFNKARILIEIFEGGTPVFFYLEKDKKVLKAPTHLWVSLNDVLISELKNQLGADSVKLKFKES